MRSTAAVLHDLQDYYDSLPIKPRHADIAAAANLPKATVTRYLNGTTKSGDLDRVRALCIAMEREDLIEKLPLRPTISTPMDVWNLLADQKLTDRESNLEEVGYERKLREESEKRLIDEMERMRVSKDNSINMLSARIEKLEIDKANQSLINKTLAADYAATKAELKTAQKYKVAFYVLFVSILVYIAVLDLPYPDGGITGLLSKLFGT